MRIRTITQVFLALTLSSSAFAATKAKPFELRPTEVQTLDNGLQILWVPDTSLPYVSLQLMLRSGSAQDPKGKEGLASFTGGMLERGSFRRTALKISEEFEQIGSSFSADVGSDYTILSSSSLSFHKETVLKLFSDILFKPTFPLGEIEKLRKVILGGIQKIADRPEDFTEFLMPRFIFGSHPYGHESIGFPKSIRSFKKTDLQKFYAMAYTPDNAMMAVVGQYDDAYKAELIKTFSAWKKKTSVTPALPDFPAWKGTELLLVNRSDLNQAQIQIGFKGVPRNINEFLELRAGIKILGESFGSRLFEEIRVKRGLTYGINAWFDPRQIAGPMGIYTFTRVDKIAETVGETLNTYRLFVKDGVTSGEVAEVKALMRGQFPRTFETAEGLARQLLILNRYGISTDYLTNYMVNLDAISKKSVNETIKRYFDPENLKILVYAPREKVEASLKTFGKVEVKEYKEFLQ